jgi:hypothetical protein
LIAGTPNARAHLASLERAGISLRRVIGDQSGTILE